MVVKTFCEALLDTQWFGSMYVGHPDSRVWAPVVPLFYGTHDCRSLHCKPLPVWTKYPANFNDQMENLRRYVRNSA